MKKSLLILIALGFSGVSHAIPWAKGYVPGYAKDCMNAEAAGTLNSLTDLNKCNSKGYVGAFNSLDNYYRYNKEQNSYVFSENINRVHVLVTDIKQDVNIPSSLYSLCESKMCYRAIIYINGDSFTGQHVATFVTTPGKPWADGTGNYTVESGRDSILWRGNRTPEMYYMAHLITDDMGLGGKVTNRFGDFYIMDHYVNSNNEDMPWAVFYNAGTAFHASPTVNGNIGSHGCTRLKYHESRLMNYLARHTGRNFTVETRYTERKALTQDQRNEASEALAYFEKQKEVFNRATSGDEEAKKKLEHDSMSSGGLY